MAAEVPTVGCHAPTVDPSQRSRVSWTCSCREAVKDGYAQWFSCPQHTWGFSEYDFQRDERQSEKSAVAVDLSEWPGVLENPTGEGTLTCSCSLSPTLRGTQRSASYSLGDTVGLGVTHATLQFGGRGGHNRCARSIQEGHRDGTTHSFRGRGGRQRGWYRGVRRGMSPCPRRRG